MTSPFEPLSASAAATIAAYSTTPQQHMAIAIGQTEHRIKLVNFWRIAPGSRVLEIGCGQGDCTAVLAEAVGPTGHVDAVDPGRSDYGSPFTLARAQAHLSGSAVGSRISWHCAEPTDYLARNADKCWDYAVLAHCIWYFDSPQATEKDAVPHVLAAVARATLEAHNKASEANIRCLSSPSTITDAAKSKGWNLVEETVVVPEEALLDGSWETGTIKSKGFLEEIDEHVEDPRVKALLRSSRDAVIGAMESLGVEKARTMDVWVARFD